MTTDEQWKPFRDGTYEVSSDGNVRRAKPGISTFAGRPLLPVAGPNGYFQVNVASDGRIIRAYVHRLVAECFLGPCPAGHMVNHKDANRQNNALANLEYVTARQNVLHALATVKRRRGPRKPTRPLMGPQRGADHWTKRTPDRIARGEQMNSKLTADDVTTIRYLVAIGNAQKDVARRMHISVAQTSRIVRGDRWGHVPAPRLVPVTLPEWLVGAP